MKRKQTIFSSAEILLPSFAKNEKDMQKWAVIACDQFTSEPRYWETCRNLIGNAPSAYSYILPEAYLGTPMEKIHGEEITAHMASFRRENMQTINGMIYLERTLPNGKVRHGLLGKLDLEAYDYTAGSKSAVRATEATVVERIPSRCKVRASAVIELPHILVLIDDRCDVFKTAAQLKENAEKVYDFDLMQGGGHASGYALTNDLLAQMTERIALYEDRADDVIYAMGDGNHSLAAAKAHWENCKEAGASMDDPARYALCEITALADDSLVFEPIYRLLKNCDPADVLRALDSVTTAGDAGQSVTVVTADQACTRAFTAPSHALTVGTLQIFLDAYIAAHPGVSCDYIHGEDSLKRLAEQPNTIGFLMEGMDKNDLFSYVSKHGTLPRKTFSMGEAESKRYYLESRQITADK